MRREVVGPDGWVFYLYMESPWMGLVGRGVNKMMTLGPRTVLVSRDWATQYGVAHEWGHVLQARRLGWKYLPWVVWHYLRSGYARSLPEREADAVMWRTAREFRDIGDVPLYGRGDPSK